MTLLWDFFSLMAFNCGVASFVFCISFLPATSDARISEVRNAMISLLDDVIKIKHTPDFKLDIQEHNSVNRIQIRAVVFT